MIIKYWLQILETLNNELSLLILALVNVDRSVPRASGDWIEFEILFERSALGGSVRESLFLQVNAHVVKHWYQQHAGSERNFGHAHLGSIATTGIGKPKNNRRDYVIYTLSTGGGCLQDV